MASPTGRRRRFLVADIEAALRATGAINSAAATILAQKYGTCSPNTVRNYIGRHKRLQRVVAEVVDQTLDLAETKLIQKLSDGHMTAIIFYLKTKGAQRGYIEHHKHSGEIRTPDVAPPPRKVNVTFNFVKPVVERPDRGGSSVEPESTSDDEEDA